MRAIFSVAAPLALLLATAAALAAQSPPTTSGDLDLDLRTQETDSGYLVLLDNREPVPVTFDLELKLNNLRSARGPRLRAVVPAHTTGQTATELVVVDRRAGYGLDIGMTALLGDLTLEDYDRDHLYELPYAAGSSQHVGQGYDGAYSHRGKRALDFNLPLGTAVHAARGGVVVDLEESYRSRCDRPECMAQNNYLVIYHADGTMADYAHLAPRGVLVERGDSVRAGQLIARSGQTGYTTGPHLHFAVYRYRDGGRETVVTRFRTRAHPEGELLRERRAYRRPAAVKPKR